MTLTLKIHDPICWHCGQIVKREVDTYVFIHELMIGTPQRGSDILDPAKGQIKTVDFSIHPYTKEKMGAAAFHRKCWGEFCVLQVL